MRRDTSHGARAMGLGACLVAAVVMISGPVAAEVRVSATPDRTRVTLGGTVNVSVSVSVDEMGSPSIIPPQSKRFTVVGHSTSTHFEISYGSRAKTSIEHVYQLRFDEPGEIRVGPFTVRTPSGRILRTEPFTVTVREPPPAPTSVEDLDPDEPLTVIMSVEPRTVYMGQELVLTITRYSRVRMAQCQAKQPRIQGAWFDDLLDAAPSPRDRVVRGVTYETGVLQRYALFPLETGDLRIPGVEVQCVTRSRGLFDSGERLTRRTAPVTVTVLPLPEQGRPQGYTGAVGRFRCAAKADRTRVRVGEPVTVTVTVSGRGNFRGFKLPPWPMPAGVKAFPPTKDEEVSYDSRWRLSGRKVLETIVVPEQAGTLDLGAYELPYFDPSEGRYAAARCPSLKLTVMPGKAGAAGNLAEALETTGHDQGLPELLPIRPTPTHLVPGAARPPALPERTWFWLASALPPGVFLFLLLGGFLARRRERNQEVTRFKRARRRAIEIMAKTGSDPWAAGVRALYSYLEDRLGEPMRGLTRDRLRQILVEDYGYPPDAVDRLIGFLEDADMARFGGAGYGDRDVRKEVEELLAAMDSHTPTGGAR